MCYFGSDCWPRAVPLTFSVYPIHNSDSFNSKKIQHKRTEVGRCPSCADTDASTAKQISVVLMLHITCSPKRKSLQAGFQQAGS